MKQIIAIIALIVVAAAIAGGLYYLSSTRSGPAANLPQGAEPAPATEEQTVPKTAGPTDPATATYNWYFSEAGTSDAGVPLTKVSFDSDRGPRDIGVFEGSCQRIWDTSWDLLPGEIDGAICFYAGAGVEIAVFREGDVVVMKKGVLEEGSEETGSVRGDFEVITAL